MPKNIYLYALFEFLFAVLVLLSVPYFLVLLFFGFLVLFGLKVSDIIGGHIAILTVYFLLLFVTSILKKLTDKTVAENNIDWKKEAKFWLKIYIISFFCSFIPLYLILGIMLLFT